MKVEPPSDPVPACRVCGGVVFDRKGFCWQCGTPSGPVPGHFESFTIWLREQRRPWSGPQGDPLAEARSVFRSIRRWSRERPIWQQVWPWFGGIVLGLVVIPVVLAMRAPFNGTVRIALTGAILTAYLFGTIALAGTFASPRASAAAPPTPAAAIPTATATSPPVPSATRNPTPTPTPTASPTAAPTETPSATTTPDPTPTPAPTATPKPAVPPSALLPDIAGYRKTDPLNGSSLALVAYAGPFPTGVINIQAEAQLNSTAAAAAADVAGTYQSFPLDDSTLDLGGTIARTGFARNRGTYDVLFTFGRASLHLEMGYTLSSTTTQRLQAVAFANSFAKEFYRNLVASQPAP